MADAQSGTNALVQGRIVWGSVKVKGRTIRGSNQPVIDPKTGQQVMEYAFGLAIPKPSSQSSPAEIQNAQTWWNAMQTEIQKIYPQGKPPKFAEKYVDGDGVKPDGGPYPAHYKGCFVVACVTRIPLKLFAWENGQIQQVDETKIKCGDYVQVSLNIAGHGPINGGSAGLYVNPSFVARVAHGEEIVNTPDPTAVFGTQAPPIPFGGSATPIGTTATPGYATPQFGQQPMGVSPATTVPPAQPHYGVVPPQFQPQQPGYPQQAIGPGQQFAAPQGMPTGGQPMGNTSGMPGYNSNVGATPGGVSGTQQMPSHNAGGSHNAMMPQMPGTPNQGAPTMAATQAQQGPGGVPTMPGMPQYRQY